MRPFFVFDFFQNAGRKAALGIGSLLLILGLLILFFPELLRTMIGLTLLGGALPLLIYGWGADSSSFKGPHSKSQQQDEEVRIIYPE